ncbi:MAG: 5-formyltetrahydrofolate cyclo-ligase [Chitinophagaceae bacterium]|nr:5-formyltetrahydrofolate cyclo-ligase [Chitinophagaceae bacterium]
MVKKQLRELYRRKRELLSHSDKLKLDDLLLIQFQTLSFDNVKNLLSFWPLDLLKEVNTHILLDYLFFRIPDLQVCFPVIDLETGNFRAVAVNGNASFQKNLYGIMEPLNGEELDPEELDLVFVPLLCFDKGGNRVGYGKGFYDKFLVNCRPDLIKTGFSYFPAEAKIDDINQFDVPLNLCITPNMIYEF